MTRHIHPNDPTYSTRVLNDWVRLQKRRQVRGLPPMDMDRKTIVGVLESGLRALFGTEYEPYKGKKQ